jgi:release factor H-coupled RctB family protein
VTITCNTSYKEILKIASNKFNKKIISVFNENHESFDTTGLIGNELFYCSTKNIDLKPAPSNTKNVVHVSVIAVNSYIQDNAINQLESLKSLDGATHIFGMPDLHVGGGVPIGSVTITNGVIHPALIGDDIGCGMSLYKTNLENTLQEKAIRKMSELLNLENGDDIYANFDCNTVNKYIDRISTDFLTKSVGTIGRGNHFSELQVVESIYDAELAKKYNIEPNSIYLTVHSGSRGLGENILNAFHNKTINIDEYKELHQVALDWARYNRDTISKRFCDQIGVTEYTKIADMFHNFYEELDGMIIHRKGSAPCKLGKLIVIPGSRGALTYVVNPLKSDISHGYSVSHGAGRKVSRNKAIDIMNDCTEVDKQKKLNLSEFGENIVICESKELFCEEAPFAYKDINVVINDLVELGLVEVVMSLRPIITYKMRCQC